MWSYYLDMLLRGYEIVGVNKHKIERIVKLREAKARYKRFMKDNDFRDVKEFFIVGLEAEVFIARNTGDVLNKDGDLFFGFFTDKYGNVLLNKADAHKAVYQYTFRRQPVKRKVCNPNDQLIKQLQAEGIL